MTQTYNNGAVIISISAKSKYVNTQLKITFFMYKLNLL